MKNTDQTYRVLHCSEMIRGGTATYLRQLIPLQGDSFGCDHIYALIPESQQSDLPVPSGITVATFQDRNPGRIRNALRMAKQALSLIHHEKIDIVHLHGTFAGATLRPLIAVFYRHVRVIYCPHGWAWDRTMSPLLSKAVCLFERLLSWFTAQIICISDYERRTAVNIAGISSKKLVVVKNAVSSMPPIPCGTKPTWPENKIRLLFVGRFDYQKGVDILLSALALMGNQVHAVLVGASVLKDSNTDYEFPGNVTVAGWLNPEELENYFVSADLLVAPSRWEGFGLTVAEAMRAGLPVVASRVGGLAELVEDGVTGILVPVESPPELADAILSIDTEKMLKMGAAGRQRIADHFTITRLHKELTAVYCEP